MAQRPADCQSGFVRRLDRSRREAILRSLRLGRDAEPRTFIDPPAGFGSTADALVEGIDGQRRDPDTGQNRAAVLAGRVLRTLPARGEPLRPDHSLHRAKPSFGRFGWLGGTLALVQCWLAGETTCPTDATT
jgi:hypothetical protein